MTETPQTIDFSGDTDFNSLLFVPKPDSGWQCKMFGMKGGVIWHPQEGQVPCRFWRKMQYLILGNKWEKV